MSSHATDLAVYAKSSSSLCTGNTAFHLYFLYDFILVSFYIAIQNFAVIVGLIVVDRKSVVS